MYGVTNDGYPADLAEAGVSEEGGATYDYAATADSFCFSVEVNGVARSVDQLQNITSGSCQYALAKWTTSSAVSVDTSTNQVVVNPNQAGQAMSPFIHNNGASSVRISFEAYVTQPSPNYTPRSRAYLGSNYYGANKVTPATNTAGYTANGNASCGLELNQWTSCSWNTPTGPDVEWVRFRVHSSPNNYTSDNVYRNIQFTVND